MKKKSLPLLLLLFYLFIFGIFVINASAQDRPITTPAAATDCPEGALRLNVKIGQLECVALGKGANPLGTYLKVWYGFIIGSVGILSTVMIMWAGLKWLTSRGNTAIIGEAKEKIFAAVIGLLLAFFSFIILNLINPQLTTLTTPELEVIKKGGGNNGGTDKLELISSFNQSDYPPGFTQWSETEKINYLLEKYQIETSQNIDFTSNLNLLENLIFIRSGNMQGDLQINNLNNNEGNIDTNDALTDRIMNANNLNSGNLGEVNSTYQWEGLNFRLNNINNTTGRYTWHINIIN